MLNFLRMVQLVPGLSLMNELFRGILNCAFTLSDKVHAHLIHNSCLACSKVTKNTKIVYTYLVLVPSSFTIHSWVLKNSLCLWTFQSWPLKVLKG